MQVEYKKDLHHSYLVIPMEEDVTISQYCIKLLERQRVEGLLALEQRVMNNQRMLYYEITSKQSMQSVLVKTTLSYRQLQKLCENILQTLERAYEYLLPEDDFILRPEHIYLNISNFDPDLCFFPGYQKNIRDQIRGLMEYLMNKVDYTDKEAVLLVYQLYAASREESYHFEELKELLMMNISQKEFKKKTSIENHEDKNEESKREDKESYKWNTYKSDKDMESKHLEPEDTTTENKKLTRRQVPVLEEKIEGEKEVMAYPFKTYLYLLGLILGGILVTMLCLKSGVLYTSFGNRYDYSKILAFFLILLCVEGYFFQKILSKNNRITKMVKTQEYVSIEREDYKNQREQKKSLASKQVEKEGRMEQLLIKKDVLSRNAGLKNNIANHKAINDIPDVGYSRINYENETGINHTEENTKVLMERNEVDSYQDKLVHNRVKDYGIGEKEGNEKQDLFYNPTCLLNAEHTKPGNCILKSVNGSYPSIIIEHYPFFIGKFKNNVDYCIEKDVISRYHAKVTQEGDEYYLTDLNSTNGTFLNGEMLLTYQKKAIKVGDEITFADLKYQFWKD